MVDSLSEPTHWQTVCFVTEHALYETGNPRILLFFSVHHQDVIPPEDALLVLHLLPTSCGHLWKFRDHISKNGMSQTEIQDVNTFGYSCCQQLVWERIFYIVANVRFESGHSDSPIIFVCHKFPIGGLKQPLKFRVRIKAYVCIFVPYKYYLIFTNLKYYLSFHFSICDKTCPQKLAIKSCRQQTCPFVAACSQTLIHSLSPSWCLWRVWRNSLRLFLYATDWNTTPLMTPRKAHS